MHIGLYAIPTIITAISEIFINVTAYGIAYTQSPKNMKGLVASINLFMSAIASILSWPRLPPSRTLTCRGCSLLRPSRAPSSRWPSGSRSDTWTTREFIINTDFSDMKKDTDSDGDSEKRNPAADRREGRYHHLDHCRGEEQLGSVTV